MPGQYSTISANRLRIHAARRFTRQLATSHYENFTVVSAALPRHLWQDFYNIYAFCRHTDDLADEISETAVSLQALADFREDLLRVYDRQTPRHPINLALMDTIGRFEIPADPFLHLIDAFEQDQRVNRYQTYAQVLDYCTRSADPVGRLVLYLIGYRDPERQRLSDYTCTALQLTNFWQDVARDYRDRNRIYLPAEDMARFGVSGSDIATSRFTPAYAELLRFEVDRAAALFEQGLGLLPLIHPRYRIDIELFSRGGQAILDRIRAGGYDTLTHRPKLRRRDKLALFAKLMLKRLL